MSTTSHIFTSPFPDVTIPTVPLTEFVLQRADEIPDRVAMINGTTGATFTFAELKDHIYRLAGGLVENGFADGMTIGLMAPNCPEYAIVFHAVALAGGTVTTINPTYGAEEVRFQLNDARASMLITTHMFAATALEAAEGTAVSSVFSIGGGDGIAALSELYGAPIAEQVEIDPITKVVVLPYSSGTTGLPKGVMLSHHNCVANLVQSEPVIRYDDENEVALAVLPFFHIYGMQVLMNGLLAQGVTVITMERFDMEAGLRLIEEHKVTRFFAVPPIVLGLAKHPLVA